MGFFLPQTQYLGRHVLLDVDNKDSQPQQHSSFLVSVVPMVGNLNAVPAVVSKATAQVQRLATWLGIVGQYFTLLQNRVAWEVALMPSSTLPIMCDCWGLVTPVICSARPMNSVLPCTPVLADTLGPF